MLSILTRGQCAQCRVCCSFESYDLFDTPLVTDEILRRALEVRPETRFSDVSGRRLFVMEKQHGSDIHFCPMLDHERGCLLGNGKPFECRIFPLRLAELDGRMVIAVSPICPAAAAMPLKTLIEEVKRLSAAIFAEGRREPQIVRSIEPGCPILAVGEKMEKVCKENEKKNE